jgi:cytochrome c oxidase subunit IV
MALLGFLFILGVIKASLVVSNFMHLRFERRFLWILGLIALFFVGFFIAGTYFDLTLTQKR